MCADHQSSLPTRDYLGESIYSFDVDNAIEKMAVHDLVSKRLNRQYLLASDIYCRSTVYKPLRSLVLSTPYRSFNTYRSNSICPRLPKPITPIEFPRIAITNNSNQPSFVCRNCHRYDFSYLNSYNREPSLFPSAQNSHRLQIDYAKFHTKNTFSAVRSKNFKQRWRIYVFILIFYFMLKKNVRVAKRKDTYYQDNYRRIRFLELLTVIHRVYLDPNCSIYQTLSQVINTSTKLLNQEILFHCVRTIIDQLANFLPSNGMLGTNNDKSILIYLLQCPLEQYPATYFWSIEKHLLSISYAKMKEHRLSQLDHFTTKFLLISTFIFHGLIKTLLLKPVKYRLVRGQLNRAQWLNVRLLSTLILYSARHAIIYKEEKNRLPMPFPFEMKNYLLDDAQLKTNFKNIDELIKSTAPILSSWASKYAERLQRHVKAITTSS